MKKTNAQLATECRYERVCVLYKKERARGTSAYAAVQFVSGKMGYSTRQVYNILKKHQLV